MKIVAELLKVKLPFKFTDNYVSSSDFLGIDLRSQLMPANQYTEMLPEYPQVFSDRMNFVTDLCVLDVLFNLGPRSLNYLKELKF